MRWMTTRLLAAVVALAVALPAAQAADDLNLSEQRFLPSPHSDDFLSVMSSHVRDTWDFNAAVLFNWSANTMIFEDGAGRTDELLTGRLTADILLSMSFFEYVSLGIDFPLHAFNMSGDPNTAFSGGPIDRGSIEGFSWGDLRISPKVRILDARETVVGVAVAIDISVPTGKTDALATDGGLSVLPRLIVDLDLAGWRAALNIGYKWRPDYDIRWLSVKPEFFLSAALSYEIIEDNLEVLGELETSAKTASFFSDENTDYLEGRLAMRYTTDSGLGVLLGGGTGFLTAYGSPLYRIFAGVSYAPRQIIRDLDGDGILDESDQCPTEPEDMDGFQDADGCPDPDNDGDGVLDVNDQCPNDPEDADGFQDADGCPDPDNDADGILDVSDKCPNKAEDRDGYQDDDGCPDPDNDGDGILDAADQCPNEPEDMDGCFDEDGCPEPGNVCVTEKKILILQKVYFKTNRATIKRESFPLLDEVAQVLKEHPELTRIEIQGHTDSRGRDRYNMKLSARRAKAVRKYLVRAGVSRKRLTAKGFGETVPIDSNDTEAGRARNRRVEFVIKERTAK